MSQNGGLDTNTDFNQQQVVTCLQALGQVAGSLSAIADIEIDTEDANDGGLKAALEVTGINVCNRLDAIFNDASRWKLPVIDSHNVLHNAALAQAKILETQVDASKLRNSALLNAIQQGDVMLQQLAGAPEAEEETAPPPTPKRTPHRRKKSRK